MSELVYQFEEPLLESLFQLLQEDLPTYLNLSGVSTDSKTAIGKCGKCPAIETITFDFDSSRGILPAIVLTHSSSETTYQTNSNNTIAKTAHQIEIDFLSKISNDLCDVIVIHRVSNAIKNLLLATNKAVFGRYYRSDNLISVVLTQSLKSNALFLEQANKAPLRGVRLFVEFRTEETGFKLNSIPMVQN